MTEYQLKRQRRRTLWSFLAAFFLHLLIFGGVLLYDLLFVEDLGDYSGPVLVKLGEPEGEDIPVMPDDSPVVEEVPEEPAPPVEESQPEAVIPDTPVTEEAPVQPRPAEESPEAVLPAESAPEQTEQSSTPVQDSVPAEPAKPTEPERPKTVSGTEAGNSWEYQFNSSGNVGRSFGTELYLYMPLPEFLSAEIYDRMTGPTYSPSLTRQDVLLRYYKPLNSEYHLETAPPVDDLRAVWDYLIDAGYDYRNADYIEGGYLRPVIISFSLSPEAELVDVRITQSSNSPEVDAAVLEGFQDAQFYNSTDREIKGRFTYRFE
ncbi:MAG: hypothetical protein PQJ50_01505 [Spirochaetales bacterium]|nr:hypothetical protein [Spirochaetales bacterium]